MPSQQELPQRKPNEPTRSSSALYKPYQDSSAGILPSQSRDKPGRGMSPSRINIYKAWLTTLFNPTSYFHTVSPREVFFNTMPSCSIMALFWWFGTVSRFSKPCINVNFLLRLRRG